MGQSFTIYQLLGFGVFKVNYMGSTGTRFDTTRNLNGHISKIDVPQVHQLVNELLQAKSNIDVKHIFLCGGSHGGFIVTHLSSQYPVRKHLQIKVHKTFFNISTLHVLSTVFLPGIL